MDEREQWQRDFAAIEADVIPAGNEKSANRELRDTVVDELLREINKRLEDHARECARQAEDEYNRYLQKRDEFYREYIRMMIR